MKLILNAIILLSLVLSGCSEKDQTYELRVSSVGVDSSSRTVRQVGLFTKGARTVRVDRGQDGHTQVGVSGGSNGGTISGTAQIILTAKLTSENGSSKFEKQSEIKTNGGRAGGPSSGTVDSNLKLSDLASFTIKAGNYAYGEEVVLGMVEGDKWVLTVE